MGRAIMFMVFMWVCVSIAGGVYQGSVSVATTTLTADITDTEDNSIGVTSTTGFPDTGIIVIDDERIAYATTTATAFERTEVLGVTVSPIIRGQNDTTAAEHLAGARVRTLESSMMNSSIDYKIATLTDSAGVTAFVTIPFAFLTLIISFVTLPIAFLGTDLQILTYIWAVFTIGIIVAIAVQLAGGRRV